MRASPIGTSPLLVDDISGHHHGTGEGGGRGAHHVLVIDHLLVTGLHLVTGLRVQDRVDEAGQDHGRRDDAVDATVKENYNVNIVSQCLSFSLFC